MVTVSDGSATVTDIVEEQYGEGFSKEKLQEYHTDLKTSFKTFFR